MEKRIKMTRKQYKQMEENRKVMEFKRKMNQAFDTACGIAGVALIVAVVIFLKLP